MNLTGSIADATAPLSAEFGSLMSEPTGSSAIDTLLQAAFVVPAFLLNLAAGVGADLGSAMGNV
ncbi:hypothetical protein [Dietzia psychralcaliphila]|uniref:Uncharacterized protein n=1 Tax=Dietzia psychralcaliphila TaxID=139021 RepID=A0AAD0JQ59_9ACTN|nr:hypothetical protein [Dietzia psychralcaliphila]AWH94744.1 hypothetical protein A6048_03630 [Dietzia psychralcaliphila]PTM86438.1 hypothetical protein C8N39_107105 [Dietzia psychralcaliphila]